MRIGSYIKKLRRAEMLTQKEFSARLSIKGPYLSQLENSKRKPSERLLLSIARTFGVNIGWLQRGKGEMYAPPSLSVKGHALIDEIHRRLVSADRPVPMSVVAKVLGIDPNNVPCDLDMSSDFWKALDLLIKVFEEEDPGKITAVLSQLRALKPGKRVLYTEGKKPRGKAYEETLPMVAEPGKRYTVHFEQKTPTGKKDE